MEYNTLSYESDGHVTTAMFLRRDSHAIGASAFKRGERPEWPHHGL